MAACPNDTVALINHFETTNEQLPNITMDHTLPAMHDSTIKSPGKTSPMGGGMVSGQVIGGPGRTMKDYEDELGALKKANFNLKLRIYFLEERMGITSADEDAIKKNIELKVENESLKKELIEKQELLSQAAKAMELIEEQKQAAERNYSQYQQSLEQERERADKLEKELEEYKARLTDATYYEETFGITPEKALELKEKLHQMEEIKASLESELKQLSASLDEERSWAQELENERDQLRIRLEAEAMSKQKFAQKRDREMESLNDKIKELEEQAFKKENSLQQARKEVIEKDKLIEEKNSLLEEKCKAYEEVSAVAEKRKRQIDQLRISIKTRDEALTDLNNKNRSLLAQFDNSYTKRSSSPLSPSISIEESQPFGKTYGLCSPNKSCYSFLDYEPSVERAKIRELYSNLETKDSQELKKELEDKEREVKKQEELKKQLTHKLYKAQEEAEVSDQKLKKLEVDYRKAIQMIQGFMKRHDQMEDKQARKDRRIVELETELSKLRTEFSRASRTSINASLRKNLSSELLDGPERDNNGQRRFEELESKINDLQDQIETIKAEKSLLEKQTQIEAEELRERLQDKDLKIEGLQCEKESIRSELEDKSEECARLKEQYARTAGSEEAAHREEEEDPEAERARLLEELSSKRRELEAKDRQLEELSRELQLKTQNLQQLVNTELWSKNREIAKLQNHYVSAALEKPRPEDASSRLNALVRELAELGVQVSFTDDVVQLNYASSDKPVDAATLTDYIHRLLAQKAELEKEVDYLRWLRQVSRPSQLPAPGSASALALPPGTGCPNTSLTDKQYCELLRGHLKELVGFMNEMLRDQTAEVASKQRRVVLDALINSRLLSDVSLAVAGQPAEQTECPVRKSKSDNSIDSRNQHNTPSDSEAFSEPDRVVSLARIGLPDSAGKQKHSVRQPRAVKFQSKACSDESDDSADLSHSHKSCQSDLGDFDTTRQILELKDINSFLYAELNLLKKELARSLGDDVITNKLTMLLTKLEKSGLYCEKLQSTLEKKIHECHALKKESKQNSLRKMQLEKKMVNVETMALELAKQKAELLQSKESADRKTAEMLFTLNKDNEMMRIKVKKMEEEVEESKAMILRLTRELDRLTLTHSQILVENTKLTNDKLRLEQDLRKSENRYEVTVRNLQDKFHKEVTDLNQINESHRARMQELEVTNKELRRHVAVCEASDSAPSSSGISSIPPDVPAKSSCDDIVNEYHTYNGFQYWLPLTYPTSSRRSKSSCSPDLGIESDAAVTSTRPLKDTLKITESMTNLLSGEDNCNNNQGLRDVDGDSPLFIEGLADEVQTLKQENVELKKRLMRTRRALENTFEHLSESNKHKKCVEKAITKQLMIAKSILKKTRNYEEEEEEAHYEN